MVHMEPCIPLNDKNGYKTLKYSLLDSIEGVFGDKWFNLKDSTRQAIDYICFISLERGFVYASPDHIASRYDIGRSTVYEALKVLREEDILVKANRSSRKQNGLGCAVHFFTIHPYFAHINDYLNLGWKPKEKADWKADEAETPCGTRLSSDSETSTLCLPSLDLEESKNIDLQSNVSQPSSSSFIKYVPREINELYAGIFNFRLRNIWQKITQAWKTIKQSILVRADLITMGSNICKRIFQVWKEKRRDNQTMTVDEMCAFAYKSAIETFYNAMASFYMEDYDSDESKLMGEAIRSIPTYENICLKVNLDYNYEDVKEHVSSCLRWGFRMLSPESLDRIIDNYEWYTTIPDSRRLVLCS
ncbi:hypothetical protein BSK59_15595 [Paenibacillus odorifer]|nr:hypothetical protein BSK59_15595 [Paenibacillus odorifer]